MRRILIVMTLIMSLTNCTGRNLEHYKGSKPKLDIKEYFTGPIKAWGIVQDRKGNVIRKFDVDMVGTWDGDNGTLDEDFRYYDGETQKRIWKITKLSDGKYAGTAGDILDKANGAQEGNAVNWSYVMDLPVGEDTYRLKFDDWMWLMNDGVLINRSYMKKFGFTVAELTIFMQKQNISKKGK